MRTAETQRLPDAPSAGAARPTAQIPAVGVDRGGRGDGGLARGAKVASAAFAVGILALGLRLYQITRSYETFIDEITYTRVALNLASGHALTLYGKPFDLQPPAILGLMAVVISTFGIHPGHNGIESTIMTLRPMFAVLGALACAGTVTLVARAAPLKVAVAAGLLMALNPFVVHYDSMVMLEPGTQAAAVACFGLLAGALSARSERAARRYAVAAGMFAGIVVTAKETFGLVAILALLVVFATGWTARRRLVALTTGIGVACYAGYLVALGSTTGIEPWWSAKWSGLLRILGIYQPTGFNSPHTHVSLLSRVGADLSHYVITYLLLAAGGLASLALLANLAPWRRRLALRSRDQIGVLVALWGIVASSYLSFETLFGSIEEQMFYIMVLPTTAALAIWLGRRRAYATRGGRRLLAGLLIVTLAYNGAVWGGVHTRSDNGYQSFIRWQSAHIPRGSTISTVEGSAQFLLEGLRIGTWSSMAELRAHRVDYVLLSTSLTKQGYAPASTRFEKQLQRSAPLRWEFEDATLGKLELFDVKALTRGGNA